MTVLTLGFIAFALVLGAFAFSHVRSVISVIVYLILLGGAYAAGVNLLSRPLPWALAWGLPSHVQVVAYRLDEPHAIYLWLSWPQARDPRAYELPWNEQRAAKLQQAASQARSAHRGLMMRVRQSGSGEDGQRMFYPEPVPSLPPKTPSS